MFRLVLFVALVVVALQSSSAKAQPHDIEGFTYLGPIPSSSNSNTGLSTKAASYYLSNTKEPWHIALSKCSQSQGKLATPLNPVEDVALRDYMVNSNLHAQAIWTGGFKSNNSWRWETNNIIMMYENFQTTACKTNTVGTQCLYASYPTGSKWGWCGAACTTANYYVCEF